MFLLEFGLYFLFTFGALMCLVSQSPVTAVLYMIFLFALTALLFIGAGAEFVGILLIIVYVGAVAVLFLFVVMMLNMGRPEDLAPRMQRLEFGVIALAAGFLALLAKAVGSNLPLVELPSNGFTNWLQAFSFRTNAEMIGSVFYTTYAHVFLLLAIVLLLAMVASIVLTLGPGSVRSLRSQDKHRQLHRSLAETIRLRRS